LPRLHHPLFANKILRSHRATNSSSSSAPTDEKFSENETRKLLESIGGAHIELVEDAD
jgi:hypothetical protein